MSNPTTKHGVLFLDEGRKLPSKVDPRPTKRYVSRCSHAYEEERLDLRSKKVYFRCINCGESYADTLYPGAELQNEQSRPSVASRRPRSR